MAQFMNSSVPLSPPAMEIIMIRKLFLFTAIFIAVPSEAACPLANILIEKYGISFSGFSHSIPRISEPSEITYHKNELKVIRLPNKNGDVPDGFHHSAWINQKGKILWIRRVGRFLSTYEWYGPIELPEADMSGCVIEHSKSVSSRAQREARLMRFRVQGHDQETYHELAKS